MLKQERYSESRVDWPDFAVAMRERRMPDQTSMPFSQFLGIEVVEVSPERVVARLKVRPELCTVPAVMHGGAVMALADTLGGIATVANLADGHWTSTIESKTNFMAAVPVGDIATAECTPLHRGKTTMVWQTKITRSDGRIAAYVTQTQLVFPAR
jgi:1,4-dihydroxy-2-naphthoyl-CoA hydrolase